ncbi:alpha-ketoglutarate-dependent dioxygenase alkB homolog 4 [Ornithorhynchus anatinus]|uniref:alpha-ketoglutarate-dependent dioxygenase alkB homolog 4 n=1 Tax=Ornithorhynchus anatinus TaxID=9258 RepID=UPI0010A8CA6C|nr:alpha-ketoglutarate-dependent dioxygenase alkB homolog 4 [Ornithorhynchus anatinus]
MDREAAGGCGCRGVRSCLLCERPGTPPKDLPDQTVARFVYCPETGLAQGAEATEVQGRAFPFPGVTLLEDFVSAEEEARMVRLMDRDPWKPSQSGRRKQDYGPKVNFRKRKLKVGAFDGLPAFSREVVRRMQESCPVLAGFAPVEQCNLDYDPARGAAIDPHLDDAWLWGERLVSLSLLAPTVLTLTWAGGPGGPEDLLPRPRPVEVAVGLPRRSLLVLHGPARHRWRHGIRRRHVRARRVCATFRELSAEFGPGGARAPLGRALLEIALTFRGKPV